MRNGGTTDTADFELTDSMNHPKSDKIMTIEIEVR